MAADVFVSRRNAKWLLTQYGLSSQQARAVLRIVRKRDKIQANPLVYTVELKGARSIEVSRQGRNSYTVTRP